MENISVKKEYKSMQITPKARLISIIVAVVFMFGALIGTGAYLIVNHINGNAIISSNFTSIGNMIKSGDNDFIDNATYQALMTALGNDTTSTRKKSAINGGTPIVFQMGTVPGTSTPIYWEVVYQTGDTITVWMTQPYSREYFNRDGATQSDGMFNGTTQTDYDQLGNYSRSTLRYATKAIYTELNSTYSVFSKVVKSPQDANIQCQKDCTSTAGVGQPDITYVNNTSYKAHHNGLQSQNGTGSYTSWTWDGTAYDDEFWIPSYYEVFNNSTSSSSINGGLWGLSDADRAFTNTRLDNGATADTYCWLRSGYSNTSSAAILVGSSGSAGYVSARFSFGVRPAAHLSLSALEDAIPPQYTISVTPNNQTYGTVSTSGGTYIEGSTLSVTATPNPNYQFVCWQRNGVQVSTSPTYEITVSGNDTYTAVFEPIMYTVTTDVNITEAGTVSGGGSYQYNTQATLTANLTNSNYKFVGWDTNGNNQYDSDEPTANPYTFTVTGDATITAIFRQLINITIRTNNAEYGQIFVNGGLTTSITISQDANTQINNIIATPKANSAFLYWYDESNGNVYYDNPLNYTVTQNTTLTAYFGNGVIDGVAVVAENGGEVRMSGYDENDAITMHVSAVAYKGYKFLGWYIMGEETPISTELSTDLALSQVQNKIIIARFIPIENQNDMNSQTDNGYNDDFA